MKIGENHYVNYTEESVVDKKRRRKSSRIIFTETKGAYTSKRIVKSKEKRFTSDIVAFCFIASLTLLLGGFFFEGYFNTAITSTKVENVITNNINGVEYDYNVKYVEYDYTKKLNQLSNLKNVFDNSSIQTVANMNLLEPTIDDYDISDYPLVETGILTNKIVIRTYEYIGVDNVSYEVKYLSWDVFQGAVMYLIPGYYEEVNQFVNEKNYKDYANLKYGIDLDLSVYDQVFNFIYRFFTFLNAPLQWLYNFIYDLGVLIGFITIW